MFFLDERQVWNLSKTKKGEKQHGGRSSVIKRFQQTFSWFFVTRQRPETHESGFHLTVASYRRGRVPMVVVGLAVEASFKFFTFLLAARRPQYLSEIRRKPL